MPNNNQVSLLTDEQVAEIEVRPIVLEMGLPRGERVLLTRNERDALCATVKQLRTDLADVSDELRVADDALENQSQWMSESRQQLTAVTQERDDLQSQLEQLRAELQEIKSCDKCDLCEGHHE